MNLESSSCGLTSGNTMEHGRVVRRDPQSSTIPSPRFNQCVLNSLSRTGGTYSRNGMMDYSRFPISELHLGKLPYSLELQSWKVKFKTEVCSKTEYHHLTLHWITEVEMAQPPCFPMQWLKTGSRDQQPHPPPTCHHFAHLFRKCRSSRYSAFGT